MPAVARKGDSVNTGHGCTSITKTLECSSDVIVNGKGAVRKGDALEVHTINSGSVCVPHSSKVNEGSSTVFVNGKPLARKAIQLMLVIFLLVLVMFLLVKLNL